MLAADYKLKKDGPSVAATLRTLFFALPRLLIVHLSRFTYTATGQSKVHKRVHFDATLRSGRLPASELLALHRRTANYSGWPAVVSFKH